MKKLLSLLVVALMMVPMISFAGDSAGTYVNESPYYSYQYPEGWKALNQETVDVIMDIGAAASGNSMAEAYIDMVRQAGIVMFMAPDMMEFAIVLAQELGMDVDASMLISFLPLMSEQFMGAVDGAEMDGDGEVLEVGDNSFAKLTITLPVSEDVKGTASLYLMTQGGTLYVLMYINADGNSSLAVFEETLASFSASK